VRNNRTDAVFLATEGERLGSTDGAGGSQPLVRGKVLNHAVQTDAGHRRPGLAITDYNVHFPRLPRKLPKTRRLPAEMWKRPHTALAGTSDRRDQRA
jgi:hypothetical protein